MAQNNHNKKTSNTQIWASFRKIDLVQFAKDKYGFQIDTSSKTGSYSKNNGNLALIYKNYTNLEMFQPSFDGSKVRKSNVILVRKNISGEYFYTAPGGDTNDAGSIIDFVAKRELLNPGDSADATKIANIIKSYDGSQEMFKQTELPKYVPQPVPIKDRNAEVARYYKLLSKLRNPEYLLARGISMETLNSVELQKRVLNTVFRDKKGNQHINISYPIVDENDKLCGINHRNVSFRGLEPGSERNIWRSNIKHADRPLDAIIIAESATDAISYAQLKDCFAENKNVLLISHEGNLHNEQIKIIQKFIDTCAPKQVVSIEDRDGAGYRYDIKLVGSLNRTAGSNNPENDFKVDISVQDRVKANMIFQVSFTDRSQGEKMVQNIKQSFASLNESESIRFNIDEKKIVYGNNSASLIVSCHVSEGNMRDAYAIVAKHRGIQDFISIDKPLGKNLNGDRIKDWNEALMTERKIYSEDVPVLISRFKESIENSSSDAAKEEIISENSFKPKELMQFFLQNWEMGLAEPQKEAIQSGVSTEVTSYLIAKNQGIAFANFLTATEKVFAIEFANFKEFTNFSKFIQETENKFSNVIAEKKQTVNAIEDKLILIKAKLNIEGDSLSIEEYNQLKENKIIVEEELKIAKKSYGAYNEYVDGKLLEALQDKVEAKSRKSWEKPLREWKTVKEKEISISLPQENKKEFKEEEIEQKKRNSLRN